MNRHEITDIDVLSREIEDGIRQVVPMTPATMTHRIRNQNLPDYVDHHPEVDDVGRLSSEALAMTYEAAAKQIEDLGRNLKDEVKSCERHTLDAVKALEDYRKKTEEAVEECRLAAEVYRTEAKQLFDHIQTRAMAADSVRQLCTEMVGKIKTA